MYKIKRFFDCQVPVNLCNFKCDYCTVNQWRAIDGEGPKKYAEFKYPVRQMAEALSPERLGGICAFNLCGNGETLLHPQIVEFTELLLKAGHFVSIVTNGTVTKAIDKLCSLDEEMRSRIFFKFSLHYIELRRMNLTEEYFSNVHKADKAGISYTVELVASDSNVPHIEEIKKLCMENIGALCHLTDPRANTTNDIRHLTEMPMEEHLKVWGQFESGLFDYRQATWGQNRKKYFCYGGVWSFNLCLDNGRLKQCYRDADTIQFIFDNIDEPIRFLPRGHFCSIPHCFNSHVFDCFAGVIPEIASPSYASLRDRTMQDGNHWLKAPYQEIYSHKVCENNEEYSDELKLFSEAIMRLAHNMDAEQAHIDIIGKYLSVLADKKITVMGDNNISGFISDKFGYKPYSENDECDVLIVTDYTDFAQIKADMKSRTSAEIISVVDLPYIK